MKRFKRKRLKEDEFVSTVNKIVRFAKERKREIMAFFVVFVICGSIILVAKLVASQSKERENIVLAQILELSSDLSEHPENLAKLEELAGGSQFSKLAYLFLAKHWYEQGDFNKAQSYLQLVPTKKKDIFYYQAQDLLAQTYFHQKNYDKAIEIYTKLEDENPDVYSLDMLLFHRAEVHEEKGEIDKALEIYRRIQDEFAQTYYGLDATQKVGKLETRK